MSGGGSDPFSGTNTRNILQHIISPKVVSDGATGYAVKTDIINLDHIYSNLKGTVTVNGINTITISNSEVTTDSVIILSVKTVDGTIGPAYISSITAGTGFAVKSRTGDTSVYNYLIIN